MRLDLPIEIFTYPEVALPDVWTVEQIFDTPSLDAGAIESQVRQSVATLWADARLRPGARVAVGSGSRGLDNLVLVVRTAVDELRARGAEPFIVPAMGSHGGATPQGQREVLEGYGLTPEAIGATIEATMDVVELGNLTGPEAGPFAGHTVWFDRIAASADAVIVINRVKAHTDFTGEIESGIAKMTAIGLGKRHGASSIHQHGAVGLKELMPRVARHIAKNGNVVGGIALIENELGRTAEVHAVPADQIAGDREMALLRRAREIAPRLPFTELDVLVIDEMGKNISGAGMDTHVIGRGHMPSISEAGWGGPNIRIVAVLDVTAPSHGNVTALGLADLTTRTLVDKADWEATLINMRTSGEGGLLRGRLPMIMPTAEDCIRTAIATCGRGDYADVRFARIRNTADLRYVEISAALLDEARAMPGQKVLSERHTLDLCAQVAPAT